MLKCPIVVLALLLYCGGNRESCREQKIVIWKIDCHFVIDDKMSNIIELYGMHKRYERREGARENERKRCERSGLGGVGVAFWEGQTSRGQECTFSSFARSPSEYKFATLSSWRGRYPHRREFSDTAGVPEASIATLTEWISNFFHPHRLRIPITRLPIYSSRWKITASLFVMSKEGQLRGIFESFSYFHTNTFLSNRIFGEDKYYLSPFSKCLFI